MNIKPPVYIMNKFYFYTSYVDIKINVVYLNTFKNLNTSHVKIIRLIIRFNIFIL